MKESVKVISLDRSEQGVVLQALTDFRNKRLEEGKTADIAADIIQNLFDAPSKKERRRVEAR